LKHGLITIILLTLLLISSCTYTSASLPTIISYNYTVYVEPVIVVKGNYSFIKYTISNGFIYQKYVPGYHKVPLIQIILLDPFNYRLSDLNIELSDPVQLTLSKPLSKTPAPKPLLPSGEPWSFSRVVNINWSYSVKHLIWRRVSFYIVYIKPFKIIDNTHIIIYRRITINTKYYYSLGRHRPDPYVYNVISRVAFNPVEPLVNPVNSVSSSIILVITRKMFLGTLQEYVSLRESEGYTVKIVTLEEIVNSTGGRDIPEKIRNYIYNEYLSYGSRLKYVLLVGDSSGEGWPNGPYNLSSLEPWEIPTRYFYNPDGTESYSHSGNYTPSDWYYVALDTTWDTNGNGIYGDRNDTVDWAPDLAIGRLPFRTVDELKAYLDTLVNYTSVPSIKYWLLTGSTLWFYGENDRSPDYGGQGDTRSEAVWLKLRNNTLLLRTRPIRLYEHYPVTTIIRKPEDQNGNITMENMVNALNTYYPDIITWFAHGSSDGAWRKIWVNDTNGDGNADSNEITWAPFIRFDVIQSPVHGHGLVVAMSCLTSYYDNPWGYDSIGELFIKSYALWYMGWNRVTWSIYTTIDEELDPDTWDMADLVVYEFLYNLLSDNSPYFQDIGYSLVYALTYFSSTSFFMNFESGRKVWWAATLLGDPAQRIAPGENLSTRIDLEPGKGHAGSIVSIKGSGFTPNSRVDLYVDKRFLSYSYCDVNGSFEKYVQIPLDLNPGPHIILAIDENGLIANTSFMVTKPSIYLELVNRSGSPEIYLYVYNLTPNQLYYVLIDNSTQYFLPCISDEQGILVLYLWSKNIVEDTLPLPSLTTGLHTITIVYYPWNYVIDEKIINPVLPLVVATETIDVTQGLVTTTDLEKRLTLLKTNILEEINETQEYLINYIDTWVNALSNRITLLNNTVIELNISLKNYLLNEISRIHDRVSEIKRIIEEEIKGNVSTLNTTLYQYIVDELSRLTKTITSLEDLVKQYEKNTRENITIVKQDFSKKLDEYRSTTMNYIYASTAVAVISLIIALIAIARSSPKP